jgi:sugar phosphate isomerase/epimerase
MEFQERESVKRKNKETKNERPRGSYSGRENTACSDGIGRGDGYKRGAEVRMSPAIEFSCADFAFPTLPHHKVLRLISLMEFSWVDIGVFKDRSHLQPADQFGEPEKTGAALKKAASDSGLGINGIFLQSSLDFAEAAINHPDAGVRSRERETFLRAVDYTLAAGSRHLTGLPGVDFGTDESPKLCVQELAWRVETAKKRGVVYAVEPHLGSIMGTPEKALAVLEEVDGLTIALDHSHFTFQGISLDRIGPLTKYASILHARGAAKGEAQTSFERNETDFAQVANHLREVRYGGRICMEYCYLRWENLNRTDNISETMKLRQFLAKELGLNVLTSDYTCG